MPSPLLGVEICSKETSQEIFGDMADSRWLRTFNENLERVKKTKGFVLQIQQGVLRERSDMQVAEEMQSGWLQVPRIGYFAFAVTDVRGASGLAEQRMAEGHRGSQGAMDQGRFARGRDDLRGLRALRGRASLQRKESSGGPRAVHFSKWKRLRGRIRAWPEKRPWHRQVRQRRHLHGTV